FGRTRRVVHGSRGEARFLTKGAEMSKRTQDFFEQLKAGEQPSLAESIRNAGATLKDLGGQLWDAGKPMFDPGRTEAAAALFAGHGHVMNMDRQEANSQEQEQTQSADLVQQKEVDGREL